MMHKLSIKLLIICLILFIMLLSGRTVIAQQPIPKITIGVDKSKNPGDVAITLQIIALLTILSLAPTILITMTSFTRIIVVLNFLRQASGTQSMPPTQLIIGLALFLTFFVMAPVINQINDKALQPYLKEEISQKQALKEAINPIKKFMLNQTRQKDIALFIKLGKMLLG